MQENYFRFNLYGDNWSDLVQSGKYVFQNRDYKVSVDNNLSFLVFSFVTEYNLDDLELFFRLAGFSAFTLEEMPDSITIPDVINLPSRKIVHSAWYGGITTRKEAYQFIEEELGQGIISRFKDVKKKQLAHKAVQLREKLASIEVELHTREEIEKSEKGLLLK